MSYFAIQVDPHLDLQTQQQGARAPGTSTLDEIGVSSQRVAEWREVRDAGEDAVERTIRRAFPLRIADLVARFIYVLTP
ncbi:MAG: hypothetical protein GXP04_12250 [Alphaproteobacteria bacterium]|nr:hypothetical protein [Alphaproteobacteria bacterium]